jgi:hypothetical protein
MRAASCQSQNATIQATEKKKYSYLIAPIHIENDTAKGQAPWQDISDNGYKEVWK